MIYWIDREVMDVRTGELSSYCLPNSAYVDMLISNLSRKIISKRSSLLA